MTYLDFLTPTYLTGNGKRQAREAVLKMFRLGMVKKHGYLLVYIYI
jgi:hypothetical protein